MTPERLSGLDASFLYMETPTTAMHVGSVARFLAIRALGALIRRPL